MALDLTDIQGNIMRGYGFPFARYVFVNLAGADASRALMGQLYMNITNAEIWTAGKPASTLNIALSRTGLRALGLPRATIEGMPDEFLEGMRARADILGDVGASAPEQWDDVWRSRVDVMFSINAQSAEAREERLQWLSNAIATCGGEIVGQQDAGVLKVGGKFRKNEHFGYTDGIAQPDFDLHTHSRANSNPNIIRQRPGNGKVQAGGRWEPIETGEFILGYPNESKELPAYPNPPIFVHNGSFMVYRKLRQNVAAFRAYFEEWGSKYPGGAEKLRAKFVGRWTDGTPLALSPHAKDREISADPMRVNNFTYADDPDGLKCPLGAHLRRMNPRDSMGFGNDLTRIRRIIRRGMPYGPRADENAPVDENDRGLVFIALNASITRQFEFVQQHWVNYGNDFGLGEERDPLIGAANSGTFTIPGDTSKGEEPFFCKDIPNFVECAGGDYFFIPSITSIRMMSEGLIDPR